MTPPERTSLSQLAADAGVAVPCAGNLPVKLDDPQFAWLVDEGAVDLFLIETRDGAEQSAPQHLLRADAGRLLPGVAPDEGDTTLGLIAKGLPGTVLRRLPAAALEGMKPAELAEQVDSWLMDLSGTLSRFVMHRPRPDAIAEPEQAEAAAQGTLSVRRGVVWVSEPPPGAGLFMNLIDWADLDAENSVGVIPLTPTSWLTLAGSAQLSARSSEALGEDGVLLSALASFHAAAFALERLNRRLAVVDQTNMERARATSRRGDEEAARQRLFNLYGLPTDDAAAVHLETLPEVLRVIGRHEGIEFRIPVRSGASESPVDLNDILDVSGIRARRVRLRPEDRWWLEDSNAILAFREEDGRPVALLPGLWGRYREIDPLGGHDAPVTAERARALKAEAWLFYRPLPSESAGLADLLRLARHGSAVDLLRLVLAGLPGGLVLLMPALALGFVANRAIPDGDPGTLYAVAAALAGFALLGALLHVLQGMALMRLEGRAASRIEAAIWDRLLRLPPGVLHRYPAGDLAMRGMTFQNLRDAIQGVVADSLLSVVFLLPAFFILFVVDAALGGIALGFSIVSLLVVTVLGLRQISPHGRTIRAVRRVAGHLSQIIQGISKLRVDSAEGSAFAVWARAYRAQKRAELGLGALEGHLQAFAAALPYAAGAVLLFATVLLDRQTMPVGDFLIVYGVFMAFQAAAAKLGDSLGAVAAMLPAFDQVRPFLAEPPESVADSEPVERLGGEVLFDHVSFRYDRDGPPVLDDVTIHAGPGEFIAIAGESGAGKSTLFRLALGIEQPSAGAVYYDGRDVRHLNAKQLRRKIGAVPQAVQLHPQDLWDNIVAHHDGTTHEEVWQAAQTAGIDREVAAMPMGMLTPVGTSGAVMSGGESQRITIARSLIRNPRVLLLDEATNWLDNENQARVMQNLAELTSTRIVIAHRLSTLKQADRIYVMRAGKVEQIGLFEELMAVEGAFRELVRRQVA